MEALMTPHEEEQFLRQDDYLFNKRLSRASSCSLVCSDEVCVSRFHRACEDGHFYLVAEFLESCRDPDCQVLATGDSPLHLTLFNDRRALTELLLRSGADPNLRNSIGWTPLHAVANREDDDDDGDTTRMFFKITAERGKEVEIDARDDLGRTPLECAVASLLPNVVDALLEHGADLTGFVFPTEVYFSERLRKSAGESRMGFVLRVASGMMAVVERLKRRGYAFDQKMALFILKLSGLYTLFKAPPDAKRALVRGRAIPASRQNHSDHGQQSAADAPGAAPIANRGRGQTGQRGVLEAGQVAAIRRARRGVPHVLRQASLRKTGPEVFPRLGDRLSDGGGPAGDREPRAAAAALRDDSEAAEERDSVSRLLGGRAQGVARSRVVQGDEDRSEEARGHRRAGCGTIDLAFELFAEDVGLASEDQLRSQNSTIYPHREQHLVAVLEKSIAEPLSRAEVVRDVRRYSRTICPVKKCRLHANSLKEEIVLTRFRAREYQTAVRDLLGTFCDLIVSWTTCTTRSSQPSTGGSSRSSSARSSTASTGIVGTVDVHQPSFGYNLALYLVVLTVNTRLILNLFYQDDNGANRFPKITSMPSSSWLSCSSGCHQYSAGSSG
ncbi:unnamed protein product [Trichogramma brassicae]|uniref:Uncharacterized protein n=1 Tax=Trichogramma brassicae TaxID=86971 RepID=A0A6H5I5D4_9HYME|nr:unnamed protein product [Trichogramma brassicae]